MAQDRVREKIPTLSGAVITAIPSPKSVIFPLDAKIQVTQAFASGLPTLASGQPIARISGLALAYVALPTPVNSESGAKKSGLRISSIGQAGVNNLPTPIALLDGIVRKVQVTATWLNAIPAPVDSIASPPTKKIQVTSAAINALPEPRFLDDQSNKLKTTAYSATITALPSPFFIPDSNKIPSSQGIVSTNLPNLFNFQVDSGVTLPEEQTINLDVSSTLIIIDSLAVTSATDLIDIVVDLDISCTLTIVDSVEISFDSEFQEPVGMYIQYRAACAMIGVAGAFELMLSKNIQNEIASKLLDVDTSVGLWLDMIGRIVGVSRKFDFFVNDNEFGFESDRSFPFNNNAPFSTKGGILTQNTLDDASYRRLIKAKILTNIGSPSIPRLNQFLVEFTGQGRGSIYHEYFGGNNINVVSDFELSDLEKAIISDIGLSPVMAGTHIVFNQ